MTSPTQNQPSILLIDDTEELLQRLRTELGEILADDAVEIRAWAPTAGDESPYEVFCSKIDPGTVLVVTDYDLTSRGKTGLFGLSIVAWCQARAIPVGDFSRKVPGLPREPNLFELRVPNTGEAEAARFIASTYRGFSYIRNQIATRTEIAGQRSLALVLAHTLEHPDLESQFSLYISWLSAANSGLLEKLHANTPSSNDKQSLLSYILGHVLFNAILKYPGPILSDEALCAYIATTSDQIGVLAPLFTSASYRDPFRTSGNIFGARRSTQF
jgi:hypothetical protein